MTMYAKVIADSIANDIRLTTMELYYPLMIHAQLMTHRMFSRNAQSNRAMPVAKMLEQVRNNPAMPSHWGKNQAGMRASEEFNGEEAAWIEDRWFSASTDSYHWSKRLSDYGLHKQVANRLTMPFQYIKVIVTATEWDNFFKLRLNDADPTMMELARKMKEAMDNSTPKELTPGEWHLPYVTNVENDEMLDLDYELLRKLSVARVARVSLNNHDKSDPVVSKDIERHDQLLFDYHMSPFEHQATPMNRVKDDGEMFWEEGQTHMDKNLDMWSGNFRGWIQYRQLVG